LPKRKHSFHNRTGFHAGPLVVAYYALGVPLAAFGVITLARLSKSGGWVGELSPFGLIAIIIAFMVGRNWVREKDQQIAQRARDQRAVQIYDWLSTSKPDERAQPYSLYLRPFTSTGHARIPLRSAVYKRGVLAGPTPGTFDPELGQTIRYKRYVTFGDFETELAALVEPQAPLIALGRTGEQIGAGRIESDDKDWRTRFELLAEHAIVIFLVPSTHEGTQWEIKRIRDDAKLLRKTVLFVPPNDTVLGGDVGPHLEIGAGKGPVGKLDLRKDAIEALAKLVPGAPISRIEKDKWGALLRLTERRRVGSYHALMMTKSLSLNPFNVGSNLHIDRGHLRREVQEIIRLACA
jgi:hypothetical protein